MTASTRSPLTPRQQLTFDFIRAHSRKEGFPPTFREIGDAVGLSSVSSVAAVVRTLVHLGYCKQHPNHPRSVVVVDDLPASAPAADVVLGELPPIDLSHAGRALGEPANPWSGKP